MLIVCVMKCILLLKFLLLPLKFQNACAPAPSPFPKGAYSYTSPGRAATSKSISIVSGSSKYHKKKTILGTTFCLLILYQRGKITAVLSWSFAGWSKGGVSSDCAQIEIFLLTSNKPFQVNCKSSEKWQYFMMHWLFQRAFHIWGCILNLASHDMVALISVGFTHNTITLQGICIYQASIIVPISWEYGESFLKVTCQIHGLWKTVAHHKFLLLIMHIVSFASLEKSEMICIEAWLGNSWMLTFQGREMWAMVLWASIVPS